MKFIPIKPLHLNRFAIVDDDDYERLSRYSWWMGGKERYPRSTGVPMHKKVMRLYNKPLDVRRAYFQRKLEIDHINCNGLDNRKENLRLVSHAVNMQNRKRPPSNGKVGVARFRDKWRARIQWFGKRHSRIFDNIDAAVTWRTEMESKLLKDNCVQNCGDDAIALSHRVA